MEETRSKKFGFSLRKVKAPDSSLTVPVTKAESGRDNNTTLAYGKGWLFSSTTLPVKVYACKANVASRQIQRKVIRLFIFV